MRVIITGGSGLIGTALSESLAKDKHEVIILSRQPDWVVGLPQGVRAVGWDGKTATGWGDLVNGAEAIVNLAGESIAGDIPFGMRWTKTRKKRILESRINAGKAVVEAIEAASEKPKVLIQSSGIDYYGQTYSADVSEATSVGQNFLAKVCIAWEDSTKAVDKFGVRRVITRSGLVLSNKGGILPIMALPFRFFAGGPNGSGNQYISWMHIDDEVGAVRFLMEKESAYGEFNLTTPNPVTNRQFAQVLGKVMRRPAFIRLPGVLFKLAIGEVSTLLLDSHKVLPVNLSFAGYEFKYPTIEGSLQNLLGKN